MVLCTAVPGATGRTDFRPGRVGDKGQRRSWAKAAEIVRRRSPATRWLAPRRGQRSGAARDEPFSTLGRVLRVARRERQTSLMASPACRLARRRASPPCSHSGEDTHRGIPIGAWHPPLSVTGGGNGTDRGTRVAAIRRLLLIASGFVGRGAECNDLRDRRRRQKNVVISECAYACVNRVRICHDSARRAYLPDLRAAIACPTRA